MKETEHLKIIPGSCAAESREQVLQTAYEILERNLRDMRASLWKPRTKPGFEGVGEKGIPWLVEVAQMGIAPGTEVLLPSHAEKVMNAMETIRGSKRLFLWIGSRNQNHMIQQEIGSVAGGADWVTLGVKNQPWSDEDHWKGIIDHVLQGGAREDRLILIHRGFAPAANGLRNPADFPMAMRIKESMGNRIPMLVDPSHIGGSAENAEMIAKESMSFRNENGNKFDGLMIEVHPDPERAITDAKQQLTWRRFDLLMERLNINRNYALVS